MKKEFEFYLKKACSIKSDPDLNRIFSSTNWDWNKYKYNSLNVAGSIAYQLKENNFKTLEEFVDGYLESGEKRLTAMKKNGMADKANFKYAFENVNNQDCDTKCYAFAYGRDEKYLEDLIDSFYENVKGKVKNKEDAASFVFARLFFESFKGDLEEQKAYKYLNEDYPEFDWERTDYSTDSKYAVDIIGRSKETNEVLVGLQVKPITYHEHENAQTKINEEKNKSFSQKYNNAPVCYIYYTEIKSKETFIIMANEAKEVLWNLGAYSVRV